MIKELLLKEEDRHLKMIYKNLEMVKYELLHDFNRSFCGIKKYNNKSYVNCCNFIVTQRTLFVCPQH